MTDQAIDSLEVAATIEIDRLNTLVAAKNWPALNLPTPEQILTTLRTGAPVDFPGMKLVLKDGQVWYSDSHGNAEPLEAKDLTADLESLLTCVARGGN